MGLLSKMFMSTAIKNDREFINHSHNDKPTPLYCLLDVYRDRKFVERRFYNVNEDYFPTFKEMVKLTQSIKKGKGYHGEIFKNLRYVVRSHALFAEYHDIVRDQWQREITMTREHAIKLGFIKDA